MIMDENLEFCDALAVAAAAGTALVGDVIDLDTIGRRMLSNNNLHLVIQVTTAFASAGASTTQFVLASDAAAAIAADGTETRHWLSHDYLKAELAAGAIIVIPLPAGIPSYERYLGIEVITGVATNTAGSINAFLTMNAADWVAMPDATN